MDTFRYVMGVLLVVGIPPAVVWWFIVHPFVGFWRGLGPRVSMTILVVALAAGFAAMVPIRDVLLGADLGTSWLTLAAGVLLMAVVARMALARRKLLTLRVLAGVPELQADGKGGRLLTEGCYARIRHPRYVEVAVGCFAYALISNYAGAYLVAAATVPLLHLIVLVEERELADRFGEEWTAYAGRVPRYWPRRRTAG